MNNLKNVFVVKDPDGSTRPSEQMAFSAATLFFFTVITLVAKFYEFEIESYQAAALASGIVGMAGSLTGIVLRWRSAGGTIKAKDSRPDIDWDSWGV